MGLLGRWFIPRRNREAAQLARALVRAFQPVQIEFLAHEGTRLLRATRAFPPDMPLPLAVARFMQSLASRELASGHHHVYRGTLSGSGLELLRFVGYCQNVREKLEDPDYQASTVHSYDAWGKVTKSLVTLRAAENEALRDAIRDAG